MMALMSMNPDSADSNSALSLGLQVERFRFGHPIRVRQGEAVKYPLTAAYGKLGRMFPTLVSILDTVKPVTAVPGV
jgi:hypothetical protein